MPRSRTRTARGSAASRRAHRRAVERASAWMSAEKFEQQVKAHLIAGERLVCLGCLGTVRKVHVHGEGERYRCAKCGRTASPQTIDAQRQEIKTRGIESVREQYSRERQPERAEAAPPEDLSLAGLDQAASRILLTDDLPASERPSGLYLPRHLVDELARAQDTKKQDPAA